ncbi:MAG: hypothetical protein JKX73_06145 [Flavobacteriales bacterium]|nr:hypothetical protein [Flavobacteriales bacterium]
MSTLNKIRWILWGFIILLVLSGITAFPIQTELDFLSSYIGHGDGILNPWFNKIHAAVTQTNLHYPYLAYGTDWLAFSHLVIAVVFWGPIKDPIKNKWVVEFGMIACIMVFPLAFIAGHIRGIPWFWQLIDCSFGVFGIIPLLVCHNLISKLEKKNV